MSGVLRDVSSVFDRYPIWSALGWFDVRVRYRRTTFGPFWNTLSTGLTIAAISVVFSGINGVALDEFMPNVAVGFVVWLYLNAVVQDSTTAFVAAAGPIKSSNLPILVHVFRLIWRNILLLAHNLPLIAIAWVISPWPITPGIVLAVPAFVMATAMLFGVSLVSAILCTRFRDVPPMVTAVMQLVFFLTPVLWTSHQSVPTIAYFNPFYYVVDAIRKPILGVPVDTIDWTVGLSCTAVALVLGLALYGRFRYRVAYWL